VFRIKLCNRRESQSPSIMAKFLLMVFVCVTGVSFALAADPWSYDKNAADGPDHWAGICGSGSRQSPINIDTSTTKYGAGLSAEWNLVNYDNNTGGNFTGSNAGGHTLKVSFDANYYKVSGGGLTGTYTTVQFHLHWGSTNTRGSEHTLDGHQFPAEIHFVSYNTKYSDINAALDHPDGLAVLGVFLEVGQNANVEYEKFLSHADKLVNKSSEAMIPAFNLGPLLPADTSKFYRYSGSLTTPTCNEAVTWTVFNHTVKISQEQLNALFTLKMNSSMHIVDNFRPVQDLNSRMVMDSSKVPPATTKGIALKISNVVLLLMVFGALFLR